MVPSLLFDLRRLPRFCHKLLALFLWRFRSSLTNFCQVLIDVYKAVLGPLNAVCVLVSLNIRWSIVWELLIVWSFDLMNCLLVESIVSMYVYCITVWFCKLCLVKEHSDTYLRTVLCETLSILEGTVYICIIVQYLSHLLLSCTVAFHLLQYAVISSYVAFICIKQCK